MLPLMSHNLWLSSFLSKSFNIVRMLSPHRSKGNQARIEEWEQSKDKMLSMSLSANCNLRRSVELAAEKGSSTWQTALPIEDQDFAMHKGEFPDALCLRYGWLPHRLPGKCECGSSFSLDHPLNCTKGAFPTIRHNELRDLTGNLLAEVCPDVCVEPAHPLNPATNVRRRSGPKNRESLT